MEGMDFYQGNTDKGSSSPSKTTEGSVTDTGKSEGDLRLMDKLLEPPVPSVELRAEEGQFEPVTPPTPQSPLAALAVYIDVNFTSALQMLRTAASAAVEEAKATLFLGSNGRFNITRRLHRGLENLWIRPCPPLTSVNFDNICLLLGSLQHQGHRCGLRTPTLGSSSGELPAVDCIHEAAAHVDGTSLSCSSADNLVGCISPENEACSADSLPATWRPFCRHDGTFIAPPLELLAAFADSNSAHKPHDCRFSLTPEGHEPWTLRPKTSFPSTVGCVVGLCVRSLLDLYIQAIRSLQPALLPKRSVVLVSAVNVPMMFRVLKEHDLIVQPLDLDPHTLMPTEQSLQNAVECWGSRVKALLCSHLYGGICDLQPLVDFSAKHKLLLIEDCAESFVGELYRGQ
ncbi:Innexin unc-9, related [Eimeria brunetti]|uniref:Innexin unc-9, related n=1 Tax=Eimeria brunetti TaxID=51314 RepID=U6LQV7_9EIME|nr:Innexin unc-9, related [Eimeria brunetti]